jgi:16S rRNA processing protein RimM
LSPVQTSQRRVEIGVVGRPHGVRGALHVFLHNTASDILKEIDGVELSATGREPAAYRISDVRRAAKSCIVALEGVDRRELAEALTGARVLVPRAALPALEDGEYYVDDLIGLEVLSGGRLVGEVIGSRAQGGIEVLTVRGELVDVEVPFVAEYIIAVDIDDARIEVGEIGDLPTTARSGRREAGV